MSAAGASTQGANQNAEVVSVYLFDAGNYERG